MMPYFVQAIYETIRRLLSRISISEDLRFMLLFIGGLMLIVLAACSVITVIHDKGTPNEHCTTLLGEATDCTDKAVTVGKQN